MNFHTAARTQNIYSIYLKYNINAKIKHYVYKNKTKRNL